MILIIMKWYIQTTPYFPLKHFFYCWLSKIDRKMAVVVVVINTKKNNNNQTKKVEIDVGYGRHCLVLRNHFRILRESWKLKIHQYEKLHDGLEVSDGIQVQDGDKQVDDDEVQDVLCDHGHDVVVLGVQRSLRLLFRNRQRKYDRMYPSIHWRLYHKNNGKYLACHQHDKNDRSERISEIRMLGSKKNNLGV